MISHFLIELYLEYFKTPHFVFVRDTLSYLTLLGLHFIMCITPSRIPFSEVEWIILSFFMGRTLMEVRQLVQDKISQKKKTTAKTESSTGSKDAVLPAEEESFAYRKLRQYFRWEYNNIWLAMDKQRNLMH